jgi:hypothetical protein
MCVVTNLVYQPSSTHEIKHYMETQHPMDKNKDTYVYIPTTDQVSASDQP